MIGALKRYIEDGRKPGRFLCALITNNLREAVIRADNTNKHLLREWVNWFQWEVPHNCWGSADAMAAWMNDKRAAQEITDEEAEQERADNSQFGVGA